MTMARGAALVAEVERCVLGAGEGRLWWLGQHGFILKLGSAVAYLDAYLSPHELRRVPPQLAPGEVTNAALVIGSHDHGDHVDRDAWPLIAQASPRARFGVPALLLPRLAADLGVDASRFVGFDDGTVASVAGFEVRAIAAAHELLDRDPLTGRHPYLGFVVKANGCTVYHAGDCCRYEGLETVLRAVSPDVMILPINGRDARRLRENCIGNMTYQEAADLAGSVKPSLVIPAHFEMFAFNSENPVLFKEYVEVKYPGLRTVIPSHGEAIAFKGRPR
jgi:L-ascorbate 6-phosphate lactonase